MYRESTMFTDILDISNVLFFIFNKHVFPFYLQFSLDYMSVSFMFLKNILSMPEKKKLYCKIFSLFVCVVMCGML
jgi:hypothetical protein